MRKDKQIVEMAEHIKGTGLPLSEAESEILADVLYMLDYRKQREGEWETILHYPRGEMFNCYSHICKAEGCGYFYKDVRPNGYKFCPNCGAKMKGGE